MTTNPPAVIDGDAFSVSRTITIAAPPAKVWAAITEPEHIAKWAGQAATLDALKVGGKAVWTWDDYGPAPLVIEELDAPHTITYRWGTSADTVVDPARSTVFRFTLEPHGDGTQLTVVETGFDWLDDPQAMMESHREGWTDELDELVAYLESQA